MATKMTLDRDQRDLLRGQALMYGDVGNLSMAIDQAAGIDERQHTTIEQVHDMVANANFIVSILDQLGWDQDADDDQYELEVDAGQMRGWLVDQAAALRSSIGDDMLTLRFQERGDENDYPDSSQEDCVDMTRNSVERGLDALEGVVNLLRQMQGIAPIGAVA
jgi:hypothetical protein